MRLLLKRLSKHLLSYHFSGNIFYICFAFIPFFLLGCNPELCKIHFASSYYLDENPRNDKNDSIGYVDVIYFPAHDWVSLTGSRVQVHHFCYFYKKPIVKREYTTDALSNFGIANVHNYKQGLFCYRMAFKLNTSYVTRSINYPISFSKAESGGMGIPVRWTAEKIISDTVTIERNKTTAICITIDSINKDTSFKSYTPEKRYNIHYYSLKLPSMEITKSFSYPSISAAVANANWVIRFYSALQMGEITDSSFCKALCTMAQNDDVWDNRVQAIRSLKKLPILNNQEAANSMKIIMEADSDIVIKIEAASAYAQAIGFYDGPSLQVISNLLCGKVTQLNGGYAKVLAIEYLTQHKQKETLCALEQFEKVLNNGEYNFGGVFEDFNGMGSRGPIRDFLYEKIELLRNGLNMKEGEACKR